MAHSFNIGCTIFFFIIHVSYHPTFVNLTRLASNEINEYKSEFPIPCAGLVFINSNFDKTPEKKTRESHYGLLCCINDMQFKTLFCSRQDLRLITNAYIVFRCYCTCSSISTLGCVDSHDEKRALT